MKERADVALVKRGLARSRTSAAELIRSGAVSLSGARIEKPSSPVEPDAALSVSTGPRFVGRGGLKLAHALARFGLDASGKVAADIGSSTGGFTDCLLQSGAKRVYAIDVGTSQLASELRSDAKVVVMENTDVRRAILPEPADVAVVDVSFVSLEKILPEAARLVKPGGDVVALVKPQFEVGREHIGKGVVKDESARAEAVARVLKAAEALGLELRGVIDSPILGGSGNKEYLARFVTPTDRT